MKKIFVLAAVAMMSFAMVSCGEKSPLDKAEDLVEQMEKAVKNQDLEAAEALYKEIEALEIDEDALTEEEKAKLEALGQRVVGIILSGAMLE